MAIVERLMDSKKLRTNLWKEKVGHGEGAYWYYNKRVDSISFRIVPPGEPTVVHYLDDHVGLLYNPETMEVVGLRVESFKHSFLPKYSALEEVWSLSDTGVELKDFGDLNIVIREEYERKKPIIFRELSRITHDIAEPKGIDLTPIPA